MSACQKRKTTQNWDPIYVKLWTDLGGLTVCLLRSSVSPAAEWWSREQLTAVETLWALTLKSALPHLENLRGHLVPELPYPSASVRCHNTHK